MAEAQLEVVIEDFIVHPTAVRRINGWFCEARAMITVKIHGREYECHRIVSFRLKPKLEEEE